MLKTSLLFSVFSAESADALDDNSFQIGCIVSEARLFESFTRGTCEV